MSDRAFNIALSIIAGAVALLFATGVLNDASSEEPTMEWVTKQ